MSFLALRKSFISFIGFTVFLSGCFRPPSPEVGLQELQVQAEERLLQDAKLAFIRAEYTEAELLLNRFVKTHRHSQYIKEGEWWLARSYEQLGKFRLALNYFQGLAKSSQNHPYRHKAGLRVQSLIETLGVEPSLKTEGVSIAWHRLLDSKDRTSLMARVPQEKGTVLLLNFGCPGHDWSRESPKGRSDRVFDWRNRFSRDLGPMIEDVSQAGQVVYLGIALPCLGMFPMASIDETPQWHDWIFEPKSRSIRISPYFSLFSSGYQTAVLGMLSKLSQFKIAGIVFQENVPLGFYQGMSLIARKRFEDAFDLQINFARMFSRRDLLSTSQGQEEGFRVTLQRPYSDVFWKWAGWKSRERLRVMTRLVQSLRAKFPHLQFGIEIHPESLSKPLYALAMFSEDWVETAQAPFDFFVARVSVSSTSETLLNSRGGFQAASQPFLKQPIQQMVDYLKNSRKVWVIRPEQKIIVGRESHVSNNGNDARHWPKGVGEIIDFSTVP